LIRYIIRRLLISVPVLFGVTLVTFLLMHATAGEVIPGLEFNPSLTPDELAQIRANLGLDRPLYVQYLTWMAGLVRGDFGRSLIDGTPVVSHIADRFPNTLELTLTAMILGIGLAIPLGILGAVRRGSRLDRFLTVGSVAGVSIPGFWLGLLLILLFAVEARLHGLPWLPSGGAISPLGGGDLLDRASHLVLPATVLAFGYIAVWSRYTRSSMVEVLSQDYVRTARAKGMSERRVLYLHALRNAVLPLITLVGLELPALVSGAAIVEVVFSWPGIGRLALESALDYDYTMVLGLTTFAGLLVVAGNLLADVLYAILDPRISLR
jgi:peptide/nickel transport system permease protein